MKNYILSVVLTFICLASFASTALHKLPPPRPPMNCTHTATGVANLMGTAIELSCTASGPNCLAAIVLSTYCIIQAKRKFSTLVFLTD